MKNQISTDKMLIELDSSLILFRNPKGSFTGVPPDQRANSDSAEECAEIYSKGITYYLSSRIYGGIKDIWSYLWIPLPARGAHMGKAN